MSKSFPFYNLAVDNAYLLVGARCD